MLCGCISCQIVFYMISNNMNICVKYIFLLFPLLILTACLNSARDDMPVSVTADQTVVVSTSTRAKVFERQEFRLSKKPDSAIQDGFQKILDTAYMKTVEANAGDNPREIGFIYSLRPTGAIYPFSEVEVSCIIQERHQDKGGEFCGKFFSVLHEEYQYLLHPETRPKEEAPSGNQEKGPGEAAKK